MIRIEGESLLYGRLWHHPLHQKEFLGSFYQSGVVEGHAGAGFVVAVAVAPVGNHRVCQEGHECQHDHSHHLVEASDPTKRLRRVDLDWGVVGDRAASEVVAATVEAHSVAFGMGSEFGNNLVVVKLEQKLAYSLMEEY
jgi:hypothetical protein